MMRLHPVEGKEIVKKLAHWKPKPALEVRKEDNAFAIPGRWHDLVAGNAEIKVRRDLARPAEERDLHLRHAGTLPSSPLGAGSGVVPHRGIGLHGGRG